MFQETDHPATLQQVLDREIECMQTVLSFSRKSLDQMETLSIKVLTEMLHYRQEWIGKIQELEQQRQGLDDGPVPEQARAALEELSALAGELVEVDKAIFRSLEARKLKYIRLLSDTAAGKGYSARQARARSSTILDITQE